MENEIVNRVASSPLITLNLEELFDFSLLMEFDLKDFLFHGLILKEKDFREALKKFNWEPYQNKYVALHCSADAIVPTWAFMLAATHLQRAGAHIFSGNIAQTIEKIFDEKINKLSIDSYQDKMMVIKGCFDKPVPVSAYVSITQKLIPRVKSIMYGEPCSTVPVFKRK